MYWGCVDSPSGLTMLDPLAKSFILLWRAFRPEYRSTGPQFSQDYLEQQLLIEHLGRLGLRSLCGRYDKDEWHDRLVLLLTYMAIGTITSLMQSAIFKHSFTGRQAVRSLRKTC